MYHAGTVFLTRERPFVTTTSSGEFQLLLRVVDRISNRAAEPWRLIWTGPEAQQFWEQHQQMLTAGTPLRVVCEHARVHAINARPAPVTEIQAHVVGIEIAPSRNTAAEATELQA